MAQGLDDVQLLDLAVEDDRGRLLLDGSWTSLNIYGPAVVVASGPLVLKGSTFFEEPRQVFWTPSVEPVTGVVGIRSASFVNCFFKSVAFAMSPEMAAEQIAAFA